MMSWLSKMSHRNRNVKSGDAIPEPVTAMLSDAGCHRSQNEDCARIVSVPGARGGRAVLVVVADGMGGHEAGEVASCTAVETIEKEYRESRSGPGEALNKAFRKAHSAILQMAAVNVAFAGMGTTCTALVIDGSQAWAAHVGDSRLYLLRGGQVYQLSEDHTQCMELVRKGLMDAGEARHHEDRNVLIRAMGTRSDFHPQTWQDAMDVRCGDSFVLCSDGLHDLVSSGEIGDTVRGADPAPACRQLVRMARERGGYDNITVAIAAIPARRATTALKETRQYEVQS